MKPAKTFERPITEADVAERLAEAIDHFTGKHGRAPSKASAAVVGNRIRVTLHSGQRINNWD